jgi:hypothetical protein
MRKLPMSGRMPKAKQVVPRRHAVTVIDSQDTRKAWRSPMWAAPKAGCPTPDQSVALLRSRRVRVPILNILRVAIGVFDLPVYPLTGYTNERFYDAAI